MSEYAICLYFDNASSERLMELMRIAADACGNKYMFEPKMIPPHITVCYFTVDGITPIEHIISNATASLKYDNTLLGANGSGKSALGRELARVLNFTHLDVETYWFYPTEIPYTSIRSQEDRNDLLLADIQKFGSFVLSGDVSHFCLSPVNWDRPLIGEVCNLLIPFLQNSFQKHRS